MGERFSISILPDSLGGIGISRDLHSYSSDIEDFPHARKRARMVICASRSSRYLALFRMQERYDPESVEQEAQEYWRNNECFSARERPGERKFYCLSMFPYPSGRLHMGHVRNYTIGDSIARYRRMRGDNVLQPMGWDAFGLPAENAALDRGVLPGAWTRENIQAMRGQLRRLGFGYDWRRELATCDPEYYRWEQWFFIRLFKKGLAYRKKALVNWDPVDQTVLANEQVIEGRGWRSGALVEQREVAQWFLRITDYAEELLEDLDRLEGQWPHQVLQMQRNWIGRSEGVEIRFSLEGRKDPLTVFTTRPDTLMGVTYMALAPGHQIVQDISRTNESLREFLNHAARPREESSKDRNGHPLGLNALHPLTGEKLPVWTANFVLMEYGSGAVMSVPAHDQRDWEFARRHGLPVRQVVVPSEGAEVSLDSEAFTDQGALVNSGEFDGMSSEEGGVAITRRLSERGCGEAVTRYRLHDWGVSRQRRWGCPVPMLHCDECGVVPVAEEDLPVMLDETLSPEAERPEEWKMAPCPKCGRMARHDMDTFDTFVESSWYQARFCSYDADAMLDDRARYWLPVDQYIGGIEHAILHLLYARFFHKLMRDEGLVEGDEPFARLLTQGMVLKDGHKMSKSRGNVVDPEPLIKRYGADTVRLFVLFASPPEHTLEWSDSGVEGCSRFLNRLWRFVHENLDCASAGSVDADGLVPRQKDFRRKLHEAIQKSGRVIDRRHTFNTVIAANMELLNDLMRLSDEGEAEPALTREALDAMLRMLAPITPHLSHALWRALGLGEAILDQPWPKADETALERSVERIVVQVNGKVRARLDLAVDAGEDEIRRAALDDDKVRRFTEGKTVIRTIHVPRKLVNVVVRDA